jgi:hypothetical protein
MAKERTKEREQAFDDEAREDLPGYPPYPPEDDIMRRAERVDGTIDDDPVNIDDKPAATDQSATQSSGDSGSKGKYDFTEEDLQALGPVDLSLDLGDDEQLKQRTQPVDFAGTDLDVPGSELDDALEASGSEDEENNSYSVGGDAHSDLEEGRQ